MVAFNKPKHLLLAFLFAPLISLSQTALVNNSPSQVCAQLYDGVSYKAPAGTPIPVAADGVVVAISQDTKFGRYAVCDKHIVVLHQNKLGKRVFTRYGELGSIGTINGQQLTVGSKLKSGQEVGKTGARGEFYFETRPVPTHLSPTLLAPNWSAVSQSDPEKFNFQTLEPADEIQAKPSSWTRYKPTDTDALVVSAHSLFVKDQGGIKIFATPAAVRLKVMLVEAPFACSTSALQRWIASVSGSLPSPTNTCIQFKTVAGRVMRAFIQDAVAEYLAREIGINDSVELFAVHVYTNSPAQTGELGLLVNEFNVIP